MTFRCYLEIVGKVKKPFFATIMMEIDAPNREIAEKISKKDVAKENRELKHSHIGCQYRIRFIRRYNPHQKRRS